MEPVPKNIDSNRSFLKKIIEYLFGYSEEPLMRRLFVPKSEKCTRTTSRLVNFVALTISKNKLFKIYFIIRFNFRNKYIFKFCS
jgi:hypothetical protein